MKRIQDLVDSVITTSFPVDAMKYTDDPKSIIKKKDDDNDDKDKEDEL